MEIKTMYKVGQTLWCLKEGKAINFVVQSISIDVGDERINYCYYNCTTEAGDCLVYAEKEVFPTKEELRKHIFGD